MQTTPLPLRAQNHLPISEPSSVQYPPDASGLVEPLPHDAANAPTSTPIKKRRRRRTKAGDPVGSDDEPKRRVVTTACIACRKRKSKCDGNTPACAACSQVYGTPCIYDPNSDHRRKGVYRNNGTEEADTEGGIKTKDSATLGIIVQALLNYPEHEVPQLVRQIRTCESLDEVAERIARKDQDGDEDEQDFDEMDEIEGRVSPTTPPTPGQRPLFESQLGLKMGQLRLDDGSVRYIGGTSHLLFLDPEKHVEEQALPENILRHDQSDAITSWTSVVSDPELITHLLNLYFTWHYSYFTCLSRPLFYRDFARGWQPASSKTEYCTPLLVNAMLALGCHFTSNTIARDNPNDSATAGDHFFREAKRLMLDNDEHEKPRIATVQALALMSVREAGCGREAKGWVYSGMSFRMASDMGLHLDPSTLVAGRRGSIDDDEEDARRVTFWGCFLFDKCWSNYLGRLPQLPNKLLTCPKFDVFPGEDAAIWTPYSDLGIVEVEKGQPARTRTVARRIAELAEISSDLMQAFYDPGEVSDGSGPKGKQAELKKLSELEIRLENWRKTLPKEMEPKEGALPSVFLMHMFFQLLFIHLFRPFLKYTAATSPLPPTVSPRRLCTVAATTISRICRLYKRSYGLGQICNISVYVIHTACTIHLLNLPDREARRDIVHGVKHLEEIAESWPGARRTLTILATLARQWKVDLPDDAAAVLQRCEARFGHEAEGESPRPPQTANSDVTSVSHTGQSVRPVVAVPRPGELTWILPHSIEAQAEIARRRVAEQRQQQSQLQLRRQQDLSQARARFAGYNPTPSLEGRRLVTATTPSATVATMTPESYFAGGSPIRADPSPMPREGSTGVADSGFSTSPANNTTPAAVMGPPALEDMFGGVEQLLRDVGRGRSASEWMAADQTQLAWGFGNWNGTATGDIGSDWGLSTEYPLQQQYPGQQDSRQLQYQRQHQQQRPQHQQQRQQHDFGAALMQTTEDAEGLGESGRGYSIGNPEELAQTGMNDVRLGSRGATGMSNVDGGWGRGWG